MALLIVPPPRLGDIIEDAIENYGWELHIVGEFELLTKETRQVLIPPYVDKKKFIAASFARDICSSLGIPLKNYNISDDNFKYKFGPYSLEEKD